MSYKFAPALAAAAVLTAGASAAVTVSQGVSAPTYGTQLNFESVATGFYAANTWAGLGLSSITDGANPGVSIVDVSAVNPWVTSNVADGFAFGLFLTFSQDATEASFQLWSSAGPPGPFGGLSVLALDANDNVVGSLGVSTPVWVTNPNNGWINITTSGGDSFSQIRIVYGGFGSPQLFADNFSWNLVPTPGAAAMLGLGLLGARRRRA